MSQPQRGTKSCRFALQPGGCRRGQACTFSHDVKTSAPGQSAVSLQVTNGEASTAGSNPSKGPRRHSTQPKAGARATGTVSQPCRAWAAQGSCKYGDNCKFRHDAPNAAPNSTSAPNAAVQPTPAPQAPSGNGYAQRRRAEAAAKQREAEAEAAKKAVADARAAAKKAETSARAAAQKAEADAAAAREADARANAAAKKAEAEARAAAKKAQDEARRAQIAERDAAYTFKRVLSGCIVTFGAGASIRSVVTGFQSSTVSVKGLPSDTKFFDLDQVIVGQGIDAHVFAMVDLRRHIGEAKLQVSVDAADALVDALRGFRGKSLSVTRDDDDSRGGSGNGYTLSMWWPAPSVRYHITCSINDASDKARELDGKFCGRRRLRAFVDTKKPWEVIADGIDVGTSDALVQTCLGVVPRRGLERDYDVPDATSLVRGLLTPHQYTQVHDTTSAGGNMISMRAHFPNRRLAERAGQAVEGLKVHCSVGAVRTRLGEPTLYKLPILRRQYDAQKAQWDALAANSRGNRDSAALVVNISGDRVFLRLDGGDKEAVGRLKVRVEELAAGQTLAMDGWRAGLSNQFVDSVSTQTGAFVIRDPRMRTLKAFGTPATIELAREQIQAELDRLAALEITFPLETRAVQYFLRKGINALREELGEENADLDVARRPPVLTVRGGEAARTAAERHIRDATSYLFASREVPPEASCPVCLMEVSSPVHLDGCGHVYCTTCFKLALSSAVENKGPFPLLCIGDDAKCGQPIPLPIIRRIITEDAFAQLLRAAFSAHVDGNADSLHYCRTPACEQIYAVNAETEARAVACPACYATVCTGCSAGAHADMTCEQNKRVREEEERANDALARQLGIKRCPGCQAPIEKYEGCNHVTCPRCNTHSCWVCMKAFTAATIYTHLGEAHGGAFGNAGTVDGPVLYQPQGIDIEEQHRILRQIEADRRARQEPRNARPAARILPGFVPAQVVGDWYRPERNQQDQEYLRNWQAGQGRREAAERQRLVEEEARLRRQREEQARRDREGSWCVIM
ncbi:hypothetical protein EXIGLDRAFT_715787 [Exidia glandulosa HHB12029]|uniref:Uncharacterized protein n=1 Tax=Exidia glandulosa HHB12029 TaxID=1314781 RepID=A0A165QJQ7_EXIGL|nr:hypothetical protein EXIGLDRAFT_715787 [Exidia glandulosa HHB12029]